MTPQVRPTYPPRGMERETIEYHGPKQLHIESYSGERRWPHREIWLVGNRTKIQLAVPKLEPPGIEVDRFAIAPNRAFIFASGRIVHRVSETVLWVQQADGRYKLLGESVGHWICRRLGLPKGREELTCVCLLAWRSGGNGVALSCAFDAEKDSWQRVEIDLVRGRFSRYSNLRGDRHEIT